MQKYINIILALLLAGIFVGCGNSHDTEIKEEVNITTSEIPKNEPTPLVQKQKMPTCYIKKGTPLTESMITVHVKCKNGNIPIDEARVILDNTVKSVAYKGTYFSDYIGFGNLQPSITYKAVLEVVVGGKTIKKSVKIKTKEEKVTPTPTPVVNTPPKWSKNLYQYNLIGQLTTSINLSAISTDVDGDIITYSIVKREIEHNPLVDCRFGPDIVPFNPDKDIYIKENFLRLKNIPDCGTKYITVTIRAKDKSNSSDTKIQFYFDAIIYE